MTENGLRLISILAAVLMIAMGIWSFAQRKTKGRQTAVLERNFVISS